MKGLAAVLTACVLLATMAFTARGDTGVARILAKTQDTFGVDCEAFTSDGTFQKDFGTWTMSAGGLDILELPLVDQSTTVITCEFLGYKINLRQTVNVFISPASPFPCGGECVWTVTPDGFYLHDPVANVDKQIFPWIAT